MALIPFVLVIISACTHGLWNFLAKRATNKDVFIGLSKSAEAILLLIPFLFLVRTNGFGNPRWPLFVSVAAGFVFLNYFFLTQAYKRIDLSVAYPISRASTLFLPLLGYVFIGERIDAIGWVSLALITIAVFGLQLNAFTRQELSRLLSNMGRPGVLFAVMAALMAASYTIWDKVAVETLPAFLYFYSYTALTALFYAILLRFRFQREAIQEEWQRHKRSIVAVALLNTFTYLLVLTALAVSKATYVGALRQLSLVVGVLLGATLLGESLKPPKVASVILLIVGSVLIAFAN